MQNLGQQFLHLPLAPAAHGKEPGKGKTVVPDPGIVRGFGEPLTPVREVTGLPFKNETIELFSTLKF